MLDTFSLKPVFMDRDGVRLAHFETGRASHGFPPLVFVNGWTGDHGIFTPQIAHFSRTHRVVAVNLRGHGASDRPEQDYTMVGFADDVAWQCRQLHLEKPVIIGHSLGGAVALELSGRHPDLPSAMVMIDSIVMTSPALRDDARLKQFLDGISGSDYLAVSRASAWDIGCDFDNSARRKAIYDQYILPPCESTPQHVAYSAMKDFLFQHNPTPAAKACTVPMAYISADVPLVAMTRDLDRLQELCPQLVIAKTLLAGHFSTIEVADQINAMLERFLSVGLNRASSLRTRGSQEAGGRV